MNKEIEQKDNFMVALNSIPIPAAITSQIEFERAVELNNRLRTIGEDVEKLKDEKTRAAKELIRQYNSEFAPVESMIERLKKSYKLVLDEWIISVEDIKNERIKKLQNEMSKAEKKGKDNKALALRTEMEMLRNTTTTARGVSVKKTWGYAIENISLIPEIYFEKVVNEKKIKKDISDGIEIPGIKTWVTTSVVTRR